MENVIQNKFKNTCGAGVKIDKKHVERELIFNEDDMLKLFKARCEDIKTGRAPNFGKKHPQQLNHSGVLLSQNIGAYTMTSDISEEDSQISSADNDNSPTLIDKKRTRKNSDLNQDQFKRFKENCKLRCINRKIILSDLLLGPKTAFEIKRIISENPEISQIRLGKNKLGDEGIKHIANFLES